MLKVKRFEFPSGHFRLYLKSVGYHGFNLYAYELFRDRHKNNSFYGSAVFAKMVGVSLSAKFMHSLTVCEYAYPYNPPGFELGYSLLRNGHADKIVEDILTTHFEITMNSSTYNSAVSKDKETSEARLYELVRILDIKDISFSLFKNI